VQRALVLPYASPELAGSSSAAASAAAVVQLKLLLDVPSWRALAAAYLLPPRPPAWYTLGLQDVEQRSVEQQRRRLLRTWLSKSSPAIPEACVGGWLERWCGWRCAGGVGVMMPACHA
jgi:hypothetical protein